MKPFEIDGYLLDLYKGGGDQVVLMVMDSNSRSPGHVDIELSTLLHGLAVLLPRFAAAIPEDPDFETSPNKAPEAP